MMFGPSTKTAPTNRPPCCWRHAVVLLCLTMLLNSIGKILRCRQQSWIITKSLTLIKIIVVKSPWHLVGMTTARTGRNLFVPNRMQHGHALIDISKIGTITRINMVAKEKGKQRSLDSPPVNVIEKTLKQIMSFVRITFSS